jgi:hypothetical protein
MLLSAAGFALLAAVAPAAILACAVYLGSANPHRTMVFFLAGGVVMTAVVGVAILIALRAGGLSLPSHRTPRYGLRTALGAASLAGGLVVARRGPRAGTKKKKRPGLVARVMARPGPVAAFVTGMLVFTPSAALIAAVQVIATARASVIDTGLTLALVVVIAVGLGWVPFVFYLVAPEATGRRLASFNGWLRAHGHAIVVGGLLVAGAVLLADGIGGLI